MQGVYTELSLIVCFATQEDSDIPPVPEIRSFSRHVMNGYFNSKADVQYKNMAAHELLVLMGTLHNAEHDIGDCFDPVSHVPTQGYLHSMGAMLHSLSEYAKHTSPKSKDDRTASFTPKSSYWTDLFGSQETTAKGFTVIPVWPPMFAKFVGGCGLYMVEAKLYVELLGDPERLFYMPVAIAMTSPSRDDRYKRTSMKYPMELLNGDFVSNTQVFLLCSKATLAYCHVLDPSLFDYYELDNYHNCASLSTGWARPYRNISQQFHDDWESRVHPSDDIMRNQLRGELSSVSFSISYIGIRSIDFKVGSWGCTDRVLDIPTTRVNTNSGSILLWSARTVHCGVGGYKRTSSSCHGYGILRGTKLPTNNNDVFVTTCGRSPLA